MSPLSSFLQAFIFLKNLLHWSIVDLQCCVDFYCAAKCFSYAHTCILFHYGVSQDNEYSFIVPCIYSIPVYSRTLLFIHSIDNNLHLLIPLLHLPSPWQPQICSLCQWVQTLILGPKSPNPCSPRTKGFGPFAMIHFLEDPSLACSRLDTAFRTCEEDSDSISPGVREDETPAQQLEN